jgi:hypothetical protein
MRCSKLKSTTVAENWRTLGGPESFLQLSQNGLEEAVFNLGGVFCLFGLFIVSRDVACDETMRKSR